MRCPRCDRPGYHPAEPCPGCQFGGDPALIEELAHVRWLLGQTSGWAEIGVGRASQEQIRLYYAARQRDLEIALGLRLPPFTDQEALRAWPELVWYETLRHKLSEWLAAGLLDPARVQAIAERAAARSSELHERLAGRPRPDDLAGDAGRLEVIRLALQTVTELRQDRCFTSAQAEEQALAPLLAEQARLEVRLGLRPAPEPKAGPAVEREAAPGGDVREAGGQADRALLPSLAPAPPAVPFRERLWRSLASERTLRSILFLGIFLLFAAAVSFVIWGWRDFTPLLRVSIPTGFTALFFVLGWYVRARMSLYRSGIALSATALLLIPIDFYTAYVNLHVLPESWPEFWLITSLACLGAYALVTWIIQSPVFGYLVGTAAGSVVLAAIEVGHKSAGLSRDWYSAGLTVLAVGMLLLGTAISRRARPGRWRVFADPFRYLALLAVGVLMPLTLAWRFIDRQGYDALHYALTINWWLGGFVLGWGAIHHRSRTLGLLAAMALPVAVYLAQAALFDRTGVNAAWHAVGWACLVPLYLGVGHTLSTRDDDPVIRGHGHTATGWGVAVLVVAALWSLTDLTSGAAAASSHAILSGAVVLAAFLWRRPKGLYAASLLALSAATFAMAELGLTVPQLSVGWASLAIAHLVLALNLGDRPSGQAFAPPLALAGYVVAALALVPPLFPYDGHLLAYALANWIGLAAWGAHLAHTGRAGFKAQEAGEGGVDAGKVQLPGAAVLLQWLAALPLPFWLWILFTNRRPLDFGLPLALAALAWGMIALGHRLARVDASYLLPWRLAGLLVSVAAPVAARVLLPHGFTLATCLLSAGLLYFADAIGGRHAISGRQAIEMAPAAGATAWGMMLFLDRLGVSFDVASLSLGLLVALYLAAGLWTERQRSRVFTHQFLAPLYLAAHALTLIVLWRVYSRLFARVFLDAPWTDEMRLWGALAQLVLGIVYGLYAWGRYEERWGHAAAWLGTASGGFLLTIYSHGRGSSAAKAALMAISFVLAERGLRWLWQRREIVRRRRALIRLAWHLYRRPLLVAGWVVSAGVIGLALIRNLWLLGGGRVQQTWAAAGLLLITGLYALAARMFRRARFVWLAVVLIPAPWTILSNLGWYTHLRFTVPGFAISWAVLAWTLFLAGLLVRRLAPRAYALPLRVMAHLLLPFSLLWGVADAETSRFTFGLAIGLYLVAAWLDARRYRRGDGGSSLLAATRFRYPAWGLVPVWCVYWVAWSLPAARHEHYGLLLLVFALLELAAGRWLPSWSPFCLQGRSSTGPGEPLEGLAGYLAAYASLVFGTMLVAHVAPLLALALLYGAALMLVSARLFRNPLWAYPAVAAVPVALLIALSEAGVPGNRHGCWLIGLAAVYFALAWLLRRVRLHAYATSVLTAGFALVALGLPPSSEDQTGALWGYGAAALLYALTALWLRQPLLLTPACALSIVPYAIGLQRSSLAPDHYGLALFPGAAIALALGWASDARTGGWQHFPWGRPSRWPSALAERLLSWWGLPLYAFGFGLAAASPFFTRSRADLAALNWALLVPLSGWAVYRFRLRGWLLALGIAGHLSVLFQFKALGWWADPARAALWFMPVTALTAFTGLFIERHRREGTPLDLRRTLRGWSRPLYLLAAADVLLGQAYSLGATTAGALVTLAHALLAAVLVWAWRSSVLAYASAALGAAALGQWLAAWKWPTMDLPVAFARLALGYGAAGYGLALWREYLPWRLLRAEAMADGTPGMPDAPTRRPAALLSVATRKRGGDPGLRPWLAAWERPLQRSAMILSLGVLVLAGWLGVDLAGWTVRALLGFPFRAIVDLATVRMAVGVLSWLGLLYVAASAVYRRLRLSYAAVGMLLAGWMLYAFYVWQLDGLARVQWYAIPAGLYLLGIAYLECQRENRVLARWLDYAAVALMMGSLFWQTLSLGWRYALMLGGEGFGALWWGSARRLRRFFYAGMIGVILATLGQLINSLQSINQWVVFGIIGLLLVIVAAVVERRLEEIRSSLQEVMEDWE